MIRRMLVPAFVVAVLASAAPLRAEVRISMENGKVTLKANNATVREILAEWARAGHARIINGERVTGGPMTIELTNVPEGQALDIILRSVAGYMAAPRATAEANASMYDRIMILPTSTAPRVAQSAPVTTPALPTFAPPPPVVSSDENEDSRVQIPRPPIFNTFPPVVAPNGIPGVTAPAPNQGPAGRGGAGTPGQMPTGVSVPGMIVQPPQPQLPIQIPQ
jgi:hypothetical protein